MEPLSQQPPAPTSADQVWRLRHERVAALADAEGSTIYGGASGFSSREDLVRGLIEELAAFHAGLATDRFRCVDVGCGTGFFAHLIRDRGIPVCGIDYSRGLLDRARTAWPELPLCQGDSYALPLASASLECVASFGLLPCVFEWQRVVVEFLRVLKPGGLGLIETNRAQPWAANLLRCASYVARGRSGPRKALDFFRATSGLFRDADSKNPSPHYFPIRTLVGFLRSRGIARVAVHDPVRYRVFPTFSFGVAFRKPDA
jgi:SAM-dependent methyltransferase